MEQKDEMIEQKDEMIEQKDEMIEQKKEVIGQITDKKTEERAIYGLEFQNVSLKRGKFELKDISFRLPKGFLLGVAGVNGAGKSTLLDVVMDRGLSFEGEIFVDGLRLKENRERILSNIGFVSDQQILFEEMTVQDNAALLAPFYPGFDEQLFQEKLRLFEISKGKTVKKMSRGQRIRFLLAFAMAHHSSLYLIDEATAGMDLVYRRDFFKDLKHMMDETDCSVVLVTHLSEELQMQADYKMLLADGQIKEFSENLQ